MKPSLPKRKKELIGAQLRKITEQSGYTAKEMGDALGITRDMIQIYEEGLCIPSTKVALRYTTLFNLPLEELFGEELGAHYKKIQESYVYKVRSKKEKHPPLNAQRLREGRKAAGIVLERMVVKINELWPELEVNENLLSRIERGTHTITEEVALAYALILEKPLKAYDAQEAPDSFDPHRLFRKQEPKPLDSELDADLETALTHLTGTEAKLIREVYWGEKTLKEIGLEQRVTGERIRQKKGRIINKMRNFFKERGYPIKEDTDKQIK